MPLTCSSKETGLWDVPICASALEPAINTNAPMVPSPTAPPPKAVKPRACSCMETGLETVLTTKLY